jgi:hypothetical protein
MRPKLAIDGERAVRDDLAKNDIAKLVNGILQAALPLPSPGLLLQLLASGMKLKFSRAADGVTISLSPQAPDKISSTVVLKIKGTPESA